MTAGAGEATLFWILGPLMLIAASGLLFLRKAVHAALAMAAVMVSLGGVYVVQGGAFLGVVQVFVYTGAVMMLFLFVLMLVGVDSSDSLIETLRGQRLVALLAVAGFTVLLLTALGRATLPRAVGLEQVNAAGNITGLAGLIFGRYVWAFELTGALLVTAALGAMVLAHRERTGPRPTQRSISEKRLRDGRRMTPLPPPGVYARNNAVDTAALLPDGTPSELSVSRVLTARGQTRAAEELVDDVPAIQAEIDPEDLGSHVHGPAATGTGLATSPTAEPSTGSAPASTSSSES